MVYQHTEPAEPNEKQVDDPERERKREKEKERENSKPFQPNQSNTSGTPKTLHSKQKKENMRISNKPTSPRNNNRRNSKQRALQLNQLVGGLEKQSKQCNETSEYTMPYHIKGDHILLTKQTPPRSEVKSLVRRIETSVAQPTGLKTH